MNNGLCEINSGPVLMNLIQLGCVQLVFFAVNAYLWRFNDTKPAIVHVACVEAQVDLLTHLGRNKMAIFCKRHFQCILLYNDCCILIPISLILLSMFQMISGQY